MKRIFFLVVILILVATQTVRAQFSQVTEADKKAGYLDKMEAKGWNEWQSAAEYQQACREASKNPNTPISWLKGGMTYRQYLQALVQGHNDLRTWETAHMSSPWTVEKMNWLLTEATVNQGNISVFSGKAVNWCYDHANKTWKYSYAEDKNYPKLIYAEMNNGTIISLCKLDCNNIFCTAVEPQKFTRTEVVTVYKTVTDTNYVTIEKEKIIYKEVLTERVQEVYRSSCGGCVQQPVYCMPLQQAQNWGLALSFSFSFQGRQYAACPQTPSNTTIVNNYYNVVNNNTVNNNTTIIDDHSVVIINPVQPQQPGGNPVDPQDPPIGGNPVDPTEPIAGNPVDPQTTNQGGIPVDPISENPNGNPQDPTGNPAGTPEDPFVKNSLTNARVAKTEGNTASTKTFTNANKGTNTTTANLKSKSAASSLIVKPVASTSAMTGEINSSKSFTSPSKTYVAPQKSNYSNNKVNSGNSYTAPVQTQKFSQPVKVYNAPQKSVQQNFSQPQNNNQRTFQSSQKSFSGPVKKF